MCDGTDIHQQASNQLSVPKTFEGTAGRDTLRMLASSAILAIISKSPIMTWLKVHWFTAQCTDVKTPNRMEQFQKLPHHRMHSVLTARKLKWRAPEHWSAECGGTQGRIYNTILSRSAKNISVRAEWLRQSGRAPSEPSETPRWRITPRPVSIPRVALHIALRSPFGRFLSLCRSPILNKHSGVVANCDHMSEWVHWVHVCIGIAMGDAAKISPPVPSTLSSRSVGSWEDMILPGSEDPRNCADPRNLGQSEWDQKLGKIECEFSLYDKMSIDSGVCRIYTTRHSVHLRYPCISVQPPSLLEHVLDRACLRCTWRRRSSELRDALGGRHWASLDMHLETEIEWTQRCTWRHRWSELRDAFGGHDWASLDMQLDTEIEWTQRCTWRPGSSEFGDALWSHARANFEAVIEPVRSYTCRP